MRTEPWTPDPGFWLAVGGVTLAALAIIFAIWAARRWGTRRAIDETFVEQTALLSNALPGEMAITYKGSTVEDPVLVTVTLTNIGPRDISSAMFDEKKPIRIELGAPYVGLVDTEPNLRLGKGAPVAIEVLLAPRLMKRRDSWTFSVIVSGPAKVEFFPELIDTDVAPRNEALKVGRDMVLDFLIGFAPFPVSVFTDRR